MDGGQDQKQEDKGEHINIKVVGGVRSLIFFCCNFKFKWLKNDPIKN